MLDIACVIFQCNGQIQRTTESTNFFRGLHFMQNAFYSTMLVNIIVRQPGYAFRHREHRAQAYEGCSVSACLRFSEDDFLLTL